MSLKPFIKTLLISALLFFALVFLGMKYHWIGFFQTKNDKNIELAIPEVAPPPDVANNGVEEEIVEGEFQPEIIVTQESGTLVENMTKEQVEKSCQQLYQAESDMTLLELAIGDCVLSNFNDPYQEVNFEGNASSTNNRQKLIQKRNILNKCQQKIDQMAYNNEVERQLLMGVCASNF